MEFFALAGGLFVSGIYAKSFQLRNRKYVRLSETEVLSDTQLTALREQAARLGYPAGQAKVRLRIHNQPSSFRRAEHTWHRVYLFLFCGALFSALVGLVVVLVG